MYIYVRCILHISLFSKYNTNGFDAVFHSDIELTCPQHLETETMAQDGFLPYPEGFATDAIHHSHDPENWKSKSLASPIETSANYKHSAPGVFEKYEYTRTGNPTRDILQDVLAKLDNAKYALAFSSGMGAISAVTFGLLSSGDHAIIGDDVYGGTNRLFSEILPRFIIETTFADLTELTNLEKAIKPNTKLIWLETPTSPTMKITDIRGAAAIAKKHHITLAVDNTFLTPYLQRPLGLGADLTMYSISKYMNGHSDVIMGSIATNNEVIYTKLKFVQNAMGIIPGPFDCYQVNRGLKTLALRMEKHKANSRLVGKFLEGHPKVQKVLHPGLPSHPQHELFKNQTSGDSGTFSMYLRGGLKESEAFLKAIKVFTLAGSLGGYQSLIELPCKMSHASVKPEMRKQLGISENFIRLSIGLEDPEYLIADLDQAFKKMEE